MRPAKGQIRQLQRELITFQRELVQLQRELMMIVHGMKMYVLNKKLIPGRMAQHSSGERCLSSDCI